uniref:Uncharacterized protein n=1 Tax=Manihot esculenta TaxID=3983 RepID=A0A2C9W8W9_MANES
MVNWTAHFRKLKSKPNHKHGPILANGPVHFILTHMVAKADSPLSLQRGPLHQARASSLHMDYSRNGPAFTTHAQRASALPFHQSLDGPHSHAHSRTRIKPPRHLHMAHQSNSSNSSSRTGRSRKAPKHFTWAPPKLHQIIRIWPKHGPHSHSHSRNTRPVLHQSSRTMTRLPHIHLPIPAHYRT